MTATPLVRLDAGKDLETALAELLATTDYPQIARWIQFPTATMLFLLVPNDPESGAIYIYDRRDAVWHSVDSEDEDYSGPDSSLRSESQGSLVWQGRSAICAIRVLIARRKRIGQPRSRRRIAIPAGAV